MQTNRKERKIIKIKNICIGEGIPKICVPLTGKTKEELLDQAATIMAENAAEHVVDLVEWRLDWLEHFAHDSESCLAELTSQLRKILGELPLLLTIRTAEEGGLAEIAWEEYVHIYKELAGTGDVDLIDVQVFWNKSDQEEIGIERISESVKELIQELKHAGVFVVGSWHNFKKTPGMQELMNRLIQMHEAGADICKVAVMPQESKDVSRLMQATKEASQVLKCPLITMSMSGLGMTSRLAGEYTGSSVTFGCVGRSSAPGQLPANDMRKILTALHKKEKLALIGFMGCGKTTQGRLLSDALGCELLDTDSMIEAEEERSISQIFEEEGERYFREKETEMIRRISQRKGMAVISTGGGLPLREENRAPLHAVGLVVFLAVTKEGVLLRLNGDTTRPLLKGPNPEEKVEELLSQRTPIYESVADVMIRTD